MCKRLNRVAILYPVNVFFASMNLYNLHLVSRDQDALILNHVLPETNIILHKANSFALLISRT